MNATEKERNAWFKYLRWRLTAVGKSKGMHGLRIVSSYLGGLAESWMATSEEPVRTTPADRLRLFLNRHGHHDAWSRVSAPFLRDRLDSGREKDVIERRFPFEQFVPDRLNPIATWKSDPTFSELEASGIIDRALLIECSYTGLVYEELNERPCDDSSSSRSWATSTRTSRTGRCSNYVVAGRRAPEPGASASAGASDHARRLAGVPVRASVCRAAICAHRRAPLLIKKGCGARASASGLMEPSPCCGIIARGRRYACHVERAQKGLAEMGRLFVVRHVGASFEPHERFATRGVQRVDVARNQVGGRREVVSTLEEHDGNIDP